MMLLLWSMVVSAQEDIQVFISFSMPKQLLIETIRDASKHQVPVVLNGFVNNAMQETMRRIAELTQEVPNLAFLIDPTAFERYAIHRVPAIVVSNTHCFDVIFGNLPLDESLRRIAAKGACGFQESA
jgi:conjugal transfer pilus assembly protein TrbC